MKAVVIGNGVARFGPRLHALLREATLIVCADGGAAHALAAGVQPHAIVGDLDSLDPAVLAHWRERGVPVEHHPVAKDHTDLELAIGWATRHGAVEIALLATLGGRLDHALGNVVLLAAPSLSGLTLSLEEEDATVALLRGGDAPFLLAGRAGDTVSLVPLSAEARGVRTSGLLYPLHGESLLRGPTRGISNEMQGARAEVQLDDGLVLVIHLRTGTVPPS